MSGFESQPIGIARRSGAVKEGWKLTNQDMAVIAEQRRAEGWEVVSMPAIHTSPISKTDGNEDDNRFGLVHVIPDNHADAFTDAYEAGDYPEYLVYRRVVEGSVFLVTELMDPEEKSLILIASHYDRQLAAGMIRSAVDEGEMYTYAKTISGRKLGTFRHEEYEPFFPTVDDTAPSSTTETGSESITE